MKRPQTVKLALDNPLLAGALEQLFARKGAPAISSAHHMPKLRRKAAQQRILNLQQAAAPYLTMGAARAAIGEQLNTILANLNAQMADAENKAALFQAFCDYFKRQHFGIVFTAHPTFSIAPPIMEAIGELAAGETKMGVPLTPRAGQQRLQKIGKLPHAHPTPISLSDENQQAEAAIARARGANLILLEEILGFARQHFPDQWQGFTPAPLDIASWVGGDMDGRNDIGWGQSLGLRWQAIAGQMNGLASGLNDLAALVSHKDLAAQMRQLASQLSRFAATRQKHGTALQSATNDSAKSVAALARQLVGSDDSAPLNGDYIDKALSKLMAAAGDEMLVPHKGQAPAPLAVKLAALRADFMAHGLGSARFHVRLNATQIHNGLRNLLQLTGEPTEASQARHGLRQIKAVLDVVKPVRTNFQSLMREQNSARRMFMLVRQLIKHGDDLVPVRFLIAESDSPFTVLGALYFARYYGVDHLVDICPLFETAPALHHGAQIIADLLADPHYFAYIKARGRLCVQTGFSDAGRQLGQIGAALAVERFQIKLAGILQKAGLSDCEVVIFNTHGESLGRGGYAGSLQDRFGYLLSDQARRAFAHNGLSLRPEVSFQGGDGYVRFATPSLALSCLTHAFIFNQSLAGPAPKADPFYDDHDQSLDFFLRLESYNRHLMEDANYGQLLTYFARNLIRPSGSRQSVRQGDPLALDDRRSAASKLRAIPQNAILQQLGWQATVLFGLGSAIGRDRDWFAEMLNSSGRMKLLFNMIIGARRRSDIHVMQAYVELYNPLLWHKLAEILPHKSRRAARFIARLLMDEGFYGESMQIMHQLMRDRLYLDQALSDNGFTINIDPHIAALHQERLARIIHLFLHIPSLPAFSSTTSLRVENVMRACLRLDIDQALATLEAAFPEGQDKSDFDFGEPADDLLETHDYRDFRRDFMQPLLDTKAQIHFISNALSHIWGAHG